MSNSARSPETQSEMPPTTATPTYWSVEFDHGQGLVVYITNQQHHRIVILRILHLG